MELSAQDVLLMGGKHIGAKAFKKPDDTRSHVDDLLVAVRYPFIIDALADALLCLLVKESEQKGTCLLKGKNLQFVGILNVHYLITDVIRSLHKIDQRMAELVTAKVGGDLR